MAESRTLREDRLTCAVRHIEDEWELDLDAWFFFGSEGLAVGTDGGGEREKGLQGHIFDGEPLIEAGDRGIVGTKDEDEILVLSFGGA